MATESMKRDPSGKDPEAPPVENIAEVARHHFGVYPQDIILIPTFENTAVYEIRFPEALYVLKTTRGNDHNPTSIAVEAYVCALARMHGVPIPEIIALDESEVLLPKSYFIMRKVRGVKFRKAKLTDELKTLVLKRVGEALRVMHSIQLEGYGRPDLKHYQSSRHLSGCSHRWHDYVQAQAQSALEHLQSSGLLSTDLITDIVELLRRGEHVLIESREGRLVHGDFTMEHIWVDVDSCKVSAIIDLGDAVIGDPVWDFVSHDWENSEVLQGLLTGYDLIRDSSELFWSKLALYRVIYTMDILVWGHGRTGIDLAGFIHNLQRYVQKAKESI
jgi:Ser/Thr protein kinase RdoA (MazF antagonist)